MWLHYFGRLRRRLDRLTETQEVFLRLARALIWLQFLTSRTLISFERSSNLAQLMNGLHTEIRISVYRWRVGVGTASQAKTPGATAPARILNDRLPQRRRSSNQVARTKKQCS